MITAAKLYVQYLNLYEIETDSCGLTFANFNSNQLKF